MIVEIVTPNRFEVTLATGYFLSLMSCRVFLQSLLALGLEVTFFTRKHGCISVNEKIMFLELSSLVKLLWTTVTKILLSFVHRLSVLIQSNLGLDRIVAILDLTFVDKFVMNHTDVCQQSTPPSEGFSTNLTRQIVP